MPHLETLTAIKNHKNEDGTTLIELINEEEIVVATILVADPKIGRMSILEDGHLVDAGTFQIAELFSIIQAALSGDKHPPALEIKPLN
jgi:hypothetical protein